MVPEPGVSGRLRARNEPPTQGLIERWRASCASLPPQRREASRLDASECSHAVLLLRRYGRITSAAVAAIATVSTLTNAHAKGSHTGMPRKWGAV